MKQTFMLLLSLIFFVPIAFGQTSDSIKNKNLREVGFDLCGTYTQLLTQNFYGFNFDFKYYPTNRFGTGAYFLISRNKISNTFTYSIRQPIVSYYEVGWINQYNILQSDRVKLNLNLTNGLTVAELGDNSIKVKYRTKYGYGYRPERIATDYFYLLEPGADISFKVISTNHYPDFWLTAKSKYRFLFGNSEYSTSKQFSNYLFAVGFTLIGFTKLK